MLGSRLSMSQITTWKTVLGLSAFIQSMEVIYTYMLSWTTHTKVDQVLKQVSKHVYSKHTKIQAVCTPHSSHPWPRSRKDALVPSCCSLGCSAYTVPCTQDVIETLSCSWANVTPQGESYTALRCSSPSLICRLPSADFQDHHFIITAFKFMYCTTSQSFISATQASAHMPQWQGLHQMRRYNYTINHFTRLHTYSQVSVILQ